MSEIKPSGPSQPSMKQGYETSGNPAEQNSTEKKAAETQASSNSEAVDQRIPTKQTSSIDEATPTSLGRGIHGAPPGEESHGETHESVGRNQELEGEQMRAPGEGDIAKAVENKSGASGEQRDLVSDLAEKQKEQASKKGPQEIGSSAKVDVQAILKERARD